MMFSVCGWMCGVTNWVSETGLDRQGIWRWTMRVAIETKKEDGSGEIDWANN